jgi:hypothetical protein
MQGINLAMLIPSNVPDLHALLVGITACMYTNDDSQEHKASLTTGASILKVDHEDEKAWFLETWNDRAFSTNHEGHTIIDLFPAGLHSQVPHICKRT